LGLRLLIINGGRGKLGSGGALQNNKMKDEYNVKRFQSKQKSNLNSYNGRRRWL
jgi:hypothetical protein